MRFRGEVESDVFRDLIYALSTLRNYDQLIADLRIEDEIAAIKEVLRKEGKL
jgi:CelD/BcsL family acetyltransferase involved in cellulose biosynthesis